MSYGLNHERTKQTEESRVFMASDTLSIRLAASLPREVQQMFSASDPLNDAFVGAVDVLHNKTSYALVLSVQTCFVWKIDMQNPFHFPTCYIFPAPSPEQPSSHDTLPYASLVPFGTSREPGLILVSSSGEVRLWDSIGIGLAGAERFSSNKVVLNEGETVSGLERIGATVFILKTTSKLYRLSLSSRSGTGKNIITATSFSDPGSQSSSWLNPFRILPRTSHTWDVGTIIAVKQVPHYQSMHTEEKLIWVLTDKYLMLWNVNLAGGEQCIRTSEVKSIVEEALCQGLDVNKQMLDVELLDVAIDNSGNPGLLVSYVSSVSGSHDPVLAPLRTYSIVRLHQTSGSGTLAIQTSVEQLPYELTLNPHQSHATIPRLAFLETSQANDLLGLTFSQFADAFAFTSSEPPYQVQMYLKKPEDVILGFDVSKQDNHHDVLILTKGMVIVARPNPTHISKLRDDANGGRITILKAIIHQAMKYGLRPENPLKFHLPSNTDGEDFAAAAEEMSYAFLVSDPNVVSSSLSLGSQLAGREASLEALITFIGDNSILGKLPITTREKLLANAERLIAARGVWQCHNELVLHHGSLNLLLSVVEMYMSQDNQADGDPLRTFFLVETPNIDKLVPITTAIVQSELSDHGTKNPRLLIQACSLVDALFANVFAYRSEYRSRYQLNEIMVQPWTSEPQLLSSVRQLFEVLATYIGSGNAKKSEPSGRDELLLLLQRLASTLFRIFDDRLRYLKVRSQENSSIERECNRLEEEFHSLRPSIFNQLVKLGCLDYSFQLAEQYRDFRALSELVYRVPAESTATRIRDYINKFKDDFTSHLYWWYIDQGKLQLLFNQDEQNYQYLDDFFDKNPAPRLSWIHDLKRKRYQQAASALLTASRDDFDRETKHLMLSVGKLATMANGPAVTPQNKLSAFDTALDFIAIHSSLLNQFTDQSRPMESTVDSYVKRLTAEKCAISSDRPALQAQFQRILRQLLQGKILSEEDAVDLLSMRNNTQYASNFVDALCITAQSNDMSEECKEHCSRSVWRRIYLHDDWRHIRSTANKTDYELAAALRRTQLYQVLKSSVILAGNKVLPSEAIIPPRSEDLVARHPGLASSQIQELIRDYERECRMLSQDGPTDSEFSHVQQLVQNDALRNS